MGNKTDALWRPTTLAVSSFDGGTDTTRETSVYVHMELGVSVEGRSKTESESSSLVPYGSKAS
jgi:hypothetical protein